jgi:hypothetical protein
MRPSGRRRSQRPPRTGRGPNARSNSRATGSSSRATNGWKKGAGWISSSRKAIVQPGIFVSEGAPSSTACIDADFMPNLTPSEHGSSPRRNAPVGFVRADLAPDGRRRGFVRADLNPGGRLRGFVRRISPKPPAICAAILAGLGSFVTHLASTNRHFGRIGFVRAASTRLTRLGTERSPRDHQCEQQQFYACKIRSTGVTTESRMHELLLYSRARNHGPWRHSPRKEACKIVLRTIAPLLQSSGLPKSPDP